MCAISETYNRAHYILGFANVSFAANETESDYY